MKRILCLLVALIVLTVTILAQEIDSKSQRKKIGSIARKSVDKEPVKAVDLFLQCLDYDNRIGDTNSKRHVETLYCVAMAYYNISDYNKAIFYGKLAVDAMSVDDFNYGTAISNVAVFYNTVGNYDEAIEWHTKALKEKERIFGKKSHLYAMSLGSLACVYHELGNYTKAIELSTQAANILDPGVNEADEDYALVLLSLSTCYSEIGDFKKAIDLAKKSVETIKFVRGKSHKTYASALTNLALKYENTGDYQKALELLGQALEIQKRSIGEDHVEYALTLSNMASVYADIDDYGKAIELAMRALDIQKRIVGENHKSYANTLNNLSTYYSSLGNDAKAIEMGSQAMEVQKNVFGESHPDYALSLMNQASCNANLGDYTKAIELGTRAFELQKNVFGVEHPLCAVSLNNLSRFYQQSENYTKAIELSTHAFEISRRINGENHPDCAIFLNQMADIYSDIGDYDKTIEYANKAIKICKEVSGENSVSYVQSLNLLKFAYYKKGDFGLACDYALRGYGIQQEYLYRNLSDMTSASRAQLWSFFSNGFQTWLPRLVVKVPSEVGIGDLYDKSCLFAKGLLLAAETDMQKLILESGDAEVVEMFNDLQVTRRGLNKLYEKRIAGWQVNTDSLERVAERLEGELVRRSKTYGDFLGNLKLTWRGVQKKLSDKDIAVEFLSFPTDEKSTQYIALTLRKGYEAPRLFTLFNEEELEAVETSYYTERELSGLVWGRLAGELEGVERIFFSPCGELYNIAIESVPHWSGEGSMGDRFEMYRLSSTRELAITRDATPSSGAVVYGGIRYDIDVAAMGTPRNDPGALYAMRGFDPAARGLRGINWKYLKGTLTEANTVCDALRATREPVTELTDAAATETTVKGLTGQKRRLLHIATHGFYWNEDDAEYFGEREKLNFLMTADDRKRTIEDKAMTRSGLLFAGAQNTFNGTEIPAGVDDGVLTAREIAQLDLRGLDLLVLSACQTGLGEVGGDGVFGLQRGFKKAGARTILMSLREVDDNATRDMMIQFYNAYTAGRGKRDAFLRAQQYLKEHDADYAYSPATMRDEHPHWAAFILLDPLE